ncbi:hypothetical protein GCM10023157_32920 [Gluconacetobacter asukensis]
MGRVTGREVRIIVEGAALLGEGTLHGMIHFVIRDFPCQDKIPNPPDIEMEIGIAERVASAVLTCSPKTRPF